MIIIMEIQTLNQLASFKVITDQALINKILDIIYNKLNISLFKYQMITSIDQLDVIKNNTFYVIPHIMGVNCWIMFCEIDGCKHQVIINKKDLKYYRNQIDVAALKIYTFNYNNNDMRLTIFDGKFIINVENSLTYNIHDIYIYKDEMMLTKKLSDKIKLLDVVTMTNMNNNILNAFNIYVASIYDVNQLNDLIFNKIKKCKLKINGLIFVPEITGKNYIYINNAEFSRSRDVIDPTIINTRYKNLSIPAIPLQMRVETQLEPHFNNTFVFKKTSITDVYELYHYDNKNKLYMNITRDKRIGIAYIPDIKTSHYCKKKGDECDIFINKCMFNVKFNKWMPILDII